MQGRTEWRYWDAGVCWLRCSCGRSSSYSCWKASKFRCCAVQLARTGIIASRLKVRCIRSCAPFSCEPGANALVLNAEAQPPHVEIGHPVNGLGGERHAVVGADRERESILAKRPLKVGFRGDGLGGERAPAREQIACMQVRDRETVAVLAIARAELPFEVRGQRTVSALRLHRDGIELAPRSECAQLLPRARYKAGNAAPTADWLLDAHRTALAFPRAAWLFRVALALQRSWWSYSGRRL